MLQSISDWFWDERKWLPEGFTWNDLKSTDSYTRPQEKDLYIAPFIALGFMIFRYAFENTIAVMICRQMGIKGSQNEYVPNQICEKLFASFPNPHQNQIREVMTKTGWSFQVVSRWFRERRKSRNSPLLRKATESCWRCFVYFTLFVYGTYVLVGNDWFWNTNKIMIGFIKNQHLDAGIKWYYILELSLYLQLCVTQTFDTKRKDFWQQYLHHVITVLLITGSYICGHYRFGAIIIYLHDASDFWLEGAKVTNYAKSEKISEILFIVFAITFYVTRWVYFPFWILLQFARENARVCGKLMSYFSFPYLMLYLCVVLMFLHIFWGLLIARMVYKFAVVGKIEKDERSDDESDRDDRGNSD